MILPKSRTENIVVQAAGNELLIYDLVTHKAYCLNETAARVYQACNGETSLDDIKHQFTEDLIFLTLDGLKKQDLIEDDYQPKFKGTSRRAAIRRIGIASLIALPVIASIAAPVAAQSQSLCSNGRGGTIPPGATVMGFGVNVSIPTAQSKALLNAEVQCCSFIIDEASIVFDCRPGSPPFFECRFSTTCS